MFKPTVLFFAYAGSTRACKNPGDSRLEIFATSVRFHESRGKVIAVRRINALGIELDLDLTGEGQTWPDTRRFVLSKDLQVLTDATHSNRDHQISRARCNGR